MTKPRMRTKEMLHHARSSSAADDLRSMIRRRDDLQKNTVSPTDQGRKLDGVEVNRSGSVPRIQ